MSKKKIIILIVIIGIVLVGYLVLSNDGLDKDEKALKKYAGTMVSNAQRYVKNQKVNGSDFGSLIAVNDKIGWTDLELEDHSGYTGYVMLSGTNFDDATYTVYLKDSKNCLSGIIVKPDKLKGNSITKSDIVKADSEACKVTD